MPDLCISVWPRWLWVHCNPLVATREMPAGSAKPIICFVCLGAGLLHMTNEMPDHSNLKVCIHMIHLHIQQAAISVVTQMYKISIAKRPDPKLRHLIAMALFRTAQFLPGYNQDMTRTTWSTWSSCSRESSIEGIFLHYQNPGRIPVIIMLQRVSESDVTCITRPDNTLTGSVRY